MPTNTSTAATSPMARNGMLISLLEKPLRPFDGLKDRIKQPHPQRSHGKQQKPKMNDERWYDEICRIPIRSEVTEARVNDEKDLPKVVCKAIKIELRRGLRRHI